MAMKLSIRIVNTVYPTFTQKYSASQIFFSKASIESAVVTV